MRWPAPRFVEVLLWPSHRSSWFILKPANSEDLLKVIAHLLSVRERKVTHMFVIFSEAAATEGRQQIGMAGNLRGTGKLPLSGKALHAGALLHLEFVLRKTGHTI